MDYSIVGGELTNLACTDYSKTSYVYNLNYLTPLTQYKAALYTI